MKYIRLPVTYPMMEGISVSRWEIVAENKFYQEDKTEDLLVYINGDMDKLELPYQTAYNLYSKGNYSESLKEFMILFNQTTDNSYQAVLARWVILCLIKLKRFDELPNILLDSIKVNMYYTDLYYLQYLVMKKMGTSDNKIKKIIDKLRIIGEAVSYPEFYHYPKILE